LFEELLEFTVADHLVQWIDAGRADPNQDVIVADRWLGYIGGAKTVLAVLRDDECFHVRSLSSSDLSERPDVARR
jgi:hypothetical protein